MTVLTLILLSLMPCVVILAGLRDLTTMTIPNWMSGLLVVGFAPAALAAGLDVWTIAAHVAVGAVALLVGAGLFALRWFGGGDAKLMAAVALWLGLGASGAFVLWTAVAGGVLSLALIAARGPVRGYAARAPAWVGRLLEPKGDIPYGVAIAAGALMAYPASALVAAYAL